MDKIVRRDTVVEPQGERDGDPRFVGHTSALRDLQDFVQTKQIPYLGQWYSRIALNLLGIEVAIGDEREEWSDLPRYLVREVQTHGDHVRQEEEMAPRGTPAPPRPLVPDRDKSFDAPQKFGRGAYRDENTGPSNNQGFSSSSGGCPESPSKGGKSGKGRGNSIEVNDSTRLQNKHSMSPDLVANSMKGVSNFDAPVASTNARAAKAQEHGRVASLEGVSIEDWLNSIGSCADLAGYTKALCQRFGSAAELVSTYGQGDGKLDPKLFEDAGVQKVGHKRLFTKWFRDNT